MGLEVKSLVHTVKTASLLPETDARIIAKSDMTISDGSSQQCKHVCVQQQQQYLNSCLLKLIHLYNEVVILLLHLACLLAV